MLKNNYEIHVTVKNNGNLEEFKSICKHIKVKPLLIGLQRDNQDNEKHLMTSSTIKTTYPDVFTELERICNLLNEHNYSVIRKKIETEPSNPIIKSLIGVNDSYYFESHFPLIIKKDDLEKIYNFAATNDIHLSKNYFKKIDSEKMVQMTTIRDYNCDLKTFKARINDLKKKFEKEGIKYQKVIIEFSVYDTYVSLDDNWMKK